MGLPPGELTDVPGRVRRLDDGLGAARRMWQRGESHQALESVDGLLEQWPDAVDAHRLRQEILRSRGRLGLLMRESEQRLTKQPDAGAWYLHGRIQASLRGKQEAFAKALEVDPNHYWGWYGTAFVLRQKEPAQAEAIYRRLLSASKGHRVPVLALARLLQVSKQPAKAARVYGSLLGKEPGTASIGLAECLQAAGKHGAAFAALLRALKKRPHDGGVRTLIRRYLARGLPDDRVRELLEPLLVDRQVWDGFLSLDGRGLLAAVLYRAGRVIDALSVLEGVERRSAAERDLYRTLLLERGDVQAFLQDVRQSMPEEFLAPDNQVAGRWRNLLDGEWMQQEDPLADPKMVAALVRHLLAAGLVQAAEQVTTLAILRYQDTQAGPLLEAWLGLQAEARRQLAFEAGLRRLVTRGYTVYRATEQVTKIKDFIRQLRRLSAEVFNKDVVGKVEFYDPFQVGDLWNPFAGGLAKHMDRYNRHLVLGQRVGQPVEALLLRRLSLKNVDPVEGVPVPPGSKEVVGEKRIVEPLNQVDLAGVALLNHYVIDMDQVRAWAEMWRAQRRMVREDEGALMHDPLPEDVGDAEPADVAWRLLMLSPVKDSELDSAVFDLIRWHELGHMVDFHHYLPVGDNLLRGLGLVLRNFFSSERISGESEGRAELVALAMCKHTRLAMAHIAGFLEGDVDGSVHADGFRRLARRLRRDLQYPPQNPPQNGAASAKVSRWHMLDPARVRESARKLLTELW